MRCASCGFDNHGRAKFCNECGTPLALCCPSCGTENPGSAKFCSECGAPLTKQPAASTLSQPASQKATRQPKAPLVGTGSAAQRKPEAERRQLTVMFCDLVGSTALSEQLDPEELRQVVRSYQEVSAVVIVRYDGHIAQYLGDGLLVYFGYPAAHEDDAARAVRAGLEIVEAIHTLNTHLSRPLQVRIGIHTGPVVVGEMGGGMKRERLALGETPNIAARVQSVAVPDTVVLSAATQGLVTGLFECQKLRPQRLKGISTPLSVYRVVRESAARSRFDVAIRTGLTPLVGREEELRLLRRRWEQAQAGEGQVVLLSGEPGIGKSRLLQTLKEQASAEGATCIEFHCSPYHQNSAFYPILDHLQRLLQFTPHEPAQAKLSKLQQVLAVYHFPQGDTLALLAAWLSLPHPDGVPLLTLSPQKQKEKTQAALVAWLVEEAERAAVYCAWEDLHWADPSTLEVLTLLLDQVPTTRLLVVLTFRPEFVPPWANRSHLSQVRLSRLGRPEVEAMVERVTGGKALPPEVVQQIVSKTDGVPLFVEELTKTVVESGLLTTVNDHYELSGPLPPLAIPATLQDSLMARLDRLSTVREIAQLGATLGREFGYELLHAVCPLDEEGLQQGLKQLVEAELVYQRGLPPQANYLFKHALIQDTAYQSLLKSSRQQLHQQIAQVLEGRFAETVETKPELVAHHYTEAGLAEQAIPYWQKAGQRAAQRSANVEAVRHLTQGLELLKTLPDTPERTQQELALQTTLGPVLIATKGYAAPEVEHAYDRARILCQQVGESPQLNLTLWGLFAFYLVRGELQTAHGLAKHFLRVAQEGQEAGEQLRANHAIGCSWLWLGDCARAQTYQERAITLFDLARHRSDAFLYGHDLGVACLSYVAIALWLRGYPEQAWKRSCEALALARTLAHPNSLAYALDFTALITQLRHEIQITQELTDEAIALANEQGLPFWQAWGSMLRGWTLATQGQEERGIAQLQQGFTAYKATGAGGLDTYCLALLAEVYEKSGQGEQALTVLMEALNEVSRTEARFYEAELYRLKGALRLQKRGQKPEARAQEEAEVYFLKALEVARQQQAKSLELRAAMSLAQLWQHQGKKREALQLLADIYDWFTEGFDTKDLQEAKALLEELH